MDNDNDKRENESVIQQTENVPRRSKGSRVCGHLKRFWWLYLVVAILLILLVVLLVIFVGVKNIAQHRINKAVLEVQGITCTNTQTNNFTMGINTTLTSDSTKATVEAFEGVMYLEDEPSHTPFVTILFPETHNKPFQTINITQFVDIPNLDALTTFNTWLLANDSLRVTVKGDTHVKVSGISHRYPVTFKKTVTLAGLRHFDGISGSNSSISATGFPDGTNFRTTVVIPNHSLVTFEIGNVSFTSYLNEKVVGTSYIDNVLLVPGNNTYALRANISQGPIITGVTNQPYCKTGILPFQLSGLADVNKDQPLPYFSNALAASNSSIDLDLDTPLRALGLNPSCPS
ncbi:hypothetical protein SPI_02986 [Niveomyces insectorum RCEF 264]|uniref:Uncharacterized protein n=1 Tax=Niveomyces insectorum RCEF 264 TaxID=1081102 RepID=A0A167WZ34_9HYPO|nr:hypothetical protein SPI_02986 [Niveomyces insectorum RCEF 264]